MALNLKTPTSPPDIHTTLPTGLTRAERELQTMSWAEADTQDFPDAAEPEHPPVSDNNAGDSSARGGDGGYGNNRDSNDRDSRDGGGGYDNRRGGGGGGGGYGGGRSYGGGGNREYEQVPVPNEPPYKVRPGGMFVLFCFWLIPNVVGMQIL